MRLKNISTALKWIREVEAITVKANFAKTKCAILSKNTKTYLPTAVLRQLQGLKCNEINNKAAKFGQTIFNPWPTPAASKLRKTEILKFAECCKFTTAADLNFHGLYT